MGGAEPRLTTGWFWFANLLEYGELSCRLWVATHLNFACRGALSILGPALWPTINTSAEQHKRTCMTVAARCTEP